MAALLLLAILVSAVPEEAARLLEKAVDMAQAGRYGQADRLYARILEEAPLSPEAETARRRLEPNALLRVRDLEINGDPANRIDVFIMAEGYGREKKFQKLFDQGADETLRYFEQAPVFRRYRQYFNFYAMNIASREDGVDREGKEYDTALGAYESGAIQKQVAVDDQKVAEYLRTDPRAEGFAIVIVRLGAFGTGGGGVAVVGGVPSNTVIHEWGHAFGNLLDEYTSEVGYTGPTPRGYNVSDSPDPERAPWKHWLDVRKKGVGMFPGGAGRSQGAWRAMSSGCAMNRGPSFCLVCREAIIAHIYDLVSPLDEATANDEVLVLHRGESKSVRVIPMTLNGSPGMEVTFTLLPVQETPESTDAQSGEGMGDYVPPPTTDWNPFEDDAEGAGSYGGFYYWNRRSRSGKELDPAPAGNPLRVSKKRLENRRTAHEVVLKASDLKPGSYLLHALVVDPTEELIRSDWKPLLSEARTWKVRVN